MARLLSSYDEIGFTILPHLLSIHEQRMLLEYPGVHVIGYATYTDGYKFTNLISETVTEHWSIDILKKCTGLNPLDTWIIFNCPPGRTNFAFQQILNGEPIDVEEWNTWSVEDLYPKVAFVTSWKLK
jgi:hypothetical protein